MNSPEASQGSPELQETRKDEVLCEKAEKLITGIVERALTLEGKITKHSSMHLKKENVDEDVELWHKEVNKPTGEPVWKNPYIKHEDLLIGCLLDTHNIRAEKELRILVDKEDPDHPTPDTVSLRWTKPPLNGNIRLLTIDTNIGPVDENTLAAYSFKQKEFALITGGYGYGRDGKEMLVDALTQMEERLEKVPKER